MIEIEEALERLRENCSPFPGKVCALPEALNRVTSETIFAREPLPRFTNSAMDGFALRWEGVLQTAGAQSVCFTIVGESRAGTPFPSELRPGETVRISTGAVVPDGADTIVPLEDADVEGDRLKISFPVKRGQHCRMVGEEVQPGDRLLPAGMLLKPAHLGLLASQGIKEVKTYPNPRVSLLISGDELAAYDTPELAEGQIRDSNSLALSSAIRQAGGDLLFLDHLRDDLREFERGLGQAVEQADLILVSGGASVGAHDYLKQAAQTTGFKTLFWQVRQQPGKPLFAATRDKKLLIGLPGNPVSALVCFWYYVVPVIRSFRGLPFGWETVYVRLGEDCSNPSRRVRIQPVMIEGGVAFPIVWKGSHELTFLEKSNGLMLVRSEWLLKQGMEVEVVRI